MQKSTQLAALLVAFCSSHALAGGGRSGNSTAAANYTALAAQLSALRLSNSSNSSGQGHMSALRSASADQQLGRAQPRGYRKKAAHVVYGKKGRASQSARQPAAQPPAHQRHNSSSARPRPQAAHNSSVGGHARKVNQPTVQQSVGNQTFNHSDSGGNNSASHPQALYRQNHRGYVLETRRQRKRRLAEKGDSSTALSNSNFTNISCNDKGHYHLVQDIDLGTNHANLPLCKDQAFQGTLKGGNHTLSLNGSEALFAKAENATIDVRLGDSVFTSGEYGPAGLLAEKVCGRNIVRLSGGPVAMHNNVDQFASVGIFGQLGNGVHSLTQSDFHASLSGTDTAGAVGWLNPSQTTLIQTDCTFQLINLISGGAGISATNQDSVLFLNQTNVTVTETERANTRNQYFGGAIGQIGSSSTVLTQTAVRIKLNDTGNAGRDEGAVFGRIGPGAPDNTTLTLRLFSGSATSGTRTVDACGTSYSTPTVRGVIDTAGYTAATASCTSNTHSTGLKLLNTTQPQPWRDAHQEFCCSSVDGIPHIACLSNTSASCHYPHEQLLATVPEGGHSVLLLSRQRYPYNNASDEQGLLRISRLQFSNLHSSAGTAELNPPFGTNATLLFKPGKHHQQLQPGHVLQALKHNGSLTLLCRTHGSDGSDYHLGTLSLNDRPDNAVVTMQPIEGLKGEPVMLQLDQGSGGGCHLWTHEQQSHTLYRYPLSPDCTLSVGVDSSETLNAGGAVIGLGTHNNTLYVASCRQTGNKYNIVLQHIIPNTGKLSGPIIAAFLLELMPTAGSDDTLITDNGTLITDNGILRLIPQNTILATEGTDQALKVWQFSLPAFGGEATWQVSEQEILQLNDKACERASTPEDALPREPLEGPLIGSAVAICGLCCTAAVAGLICKKKCCQHHKNRTNRAPTQSSIAPTNDTVAAMELQGRSSTAGEPGTNQEPPPPYPSTETDQELTPPPPYPSS